MVVIPRTRPSEADLRAQGEKQQQQRARGQRTAEQEDEEDKGERGEEGETEGRAAAAGGEKQARPQESWGATQCLMGAYA